MDMGYWLGRKYALLQQQADATTQSAATGAMTGAADARVNNTRATLMPAESRAGIAQTNAQTGLLNEQTQWLGPEARARIAGLDAGTAFTGTQNKVLTRESLTALPNLFGPTRMPTMGSILGAPVVAASTRRLGESDAEYLARGGR